MRRAAGHWSAMATALRELQRPADQAMEAALSAIEGQTHDAMSSYWHEVTGGDGSELQKFIDTCDNFAKQLEHGATDIEYAKLSIYISVASMLAMAFIPVVGQAVDAAAAAAVKLFVRKTVQELIDKLALKGASFLAERVGLGVAEKLGTNAASSLVVNVGKQAVIGAGLGAGTDVAAQGIQVAEGHRDGIDGNSVWQSAASGAVAGAVAGPVSQGIEAAGTKVTGGLADRLGIEHEPGKLASYLTSGASAIPGNLAGNAAASVSSAALTGGPVDFGSIHDGAGGGLIAKPHQAPHPETSSHTDTAPAADTAGHSRDAPASARTEQPPTTSTTATRADTSVASDAPRPEANTAPAAATPVAHDTPTTASTTATGHTDSVAAHPNSANVDHNGGVPPDSHAAPAGGPAAVDRSPAGQPAATPITHAPDRAAVQAPESVPPKGTGPAPDRPMPALPGDRPAPPSTSRPLADIPQRPDLAARPDTQAPPSDRTVAPQRGTDIPRPSRVDVPDSATPSPRDTSGSSHRLDSVPHAPTDRGPVPPRSPEAPRTPTGVEVPDRHPAPGARDINTTPRGPEASASPSTDRPSGGTDGRTQAPGPIIAGVPVAGPHGVAARSPHETAGPPDSRRGRSDASQPNQKRPERDNGSPRKGQEQPRLRPDDHEPEHHRPHESTAERELPADSADHAVDRTRENAPSGSDPHSGTPGLERLVPHEPGAELRELSYGDQKIIGEYAAKRGVSFDDVVRGIQDGSLVLGRHYVFERPTLLETPEQLDPRYLTEVVAHKIDNPRNPRRYANMEPDAFEAGCPDSELPVHLSRSMSGDALASAVTPTDLTKMVVNYDGDGLSPVWRDHSAADAFLDARNALFRMDSRGPEIFGPGFAPRDPSNLSISAHVGDTGRGHADGFVSLSKSPERTIARERTIAADDLDRLAAEGKLERLPDGTFRQIRYMHELYHAHGIDVDATFHDATAHRRYNEGTHYEAEVLAPGGISGDTIYRIWPREIIVDAHGSPVSVTVGEPIYNPRFAHLDNPRFTATHDVPAQAHSRSADEHAQHRQGPPDRVDNDSPATEHAPAPRPDNSPQRTESVHPDHRPQVRESLQAPESHPYEPWLYRAPESEPPRPQQPWPSHTAPESVPPLPHAPTRESATASAQPHPMPTPHRAPEPPPTVPPTRGPEVAPPHSNRVDPHQQVAPGPRPAQTNVPAAPHVPSTPRPEPRPPVPHRPVPERGHAVPPHERPATPPPREGAHTPPPRDRFREHGPRPVHRGDSPVAPHDPRQARPHVDARPPVHPQQMQRAAAARQAREFYRGQPPEDRRVTPVRTGNGPEGKPAYGFRRYPEAPGGPIAVAGVKVHVTFDRSVTPDQVGRVWERAQLATDLVFNHGQRLLSGDRVLVDLAHTADPAEANLHIHVSDIAGPWHPDSHLDAVADRLREQLGLSAEPRQHGAGLSTDEIRRISNDIAKSNTPAALDGLPETRVIGSGHLQQLERAEYQHAVEDALRDGNRFLVGADPRTNPYGWQINDGGLRRPGRNTNCVDNCLAALSCFHGRPEVALARWRDHADEAGDVGESPDRAGAWIGGQWGHYNDGRSIAAQYQALHERMLRAGPGSSALVGQSWHARDDNGVPLYHRDGSPVLNGGHAIVIVYPHGASGPVWWDPQAAAFSDHPPRALTDRAAEMVYMTVDPERGHLGGARTGDQGTSSALSGTDLRSHGGVPDVPVRVRMGVPAEAHPAADGGRSADRVGELRGEHADRGGHGARESGSDHDRGDVRRSDPDRSAGAGVSDLPRAVEGEHPTHPRERADDRVPRPHAEPDSPARAFRGLSADDRQDHLRLSADSAPGDERPVLGGTQEPPGRHLADRGNLRGIDHGEPARDANGALTTSTPQMNLAGTDPTPSEEHGHRDSSGPDESRASRDRLGRPWDPNRYEIASRRPDPDSTGSEASRAARDKLGRPWDPNRYEIASRRPDPDSTGSEASRAARDKLGRPWDPNRYEIASRRPDPDSTGSEASRAARDKLGRPWVPNRYEIASRRPDPDSTGSEASRAARDKLGRPWVPNRYEIASRRPDPDSTGSEASRAARDKLGRPWVPNRYEIASRTPDPDTTRSESTEKPSKPAPSVSELREAAFGGTKGADVVREHDHPGGDQQRIPVNELVDRVRDRVAGDLEKFALRYSDTELRALVEQGRRLGIDDRGITDLIQVGSRIAKPITADTLARHMDNWVNVVSERGYPYRFDSADHFNAFARDFHEALEKAGLGDLDPFIQGSALRKPEAKDVDFALTVDRDRFYEILTDRFDGRAATRATETSSAAPLNLKDLTRSEIRELAEHIDANRDAYNSQARTFSNAVLKGVIRSTSDISKPLKAAGKEIQQKYPELNIEDISLVVPDSAFDSSPELPVVPTTEKARAQELVQRLNQARELEFRSEHPSVERTAAPGEVEGLYRIPGELPSEKPVPAVPERDDLPAPKGMYRGDDGLLHKPGDRPDSYRTRADGRLHDVTDPVGTFRDTNYKLHDEIGFTADHLTDKDVIYKAMSEANWSHTVENEQIREQIASTSEARKQQDIDQRPLAEAAERIMPEFNVEKIDDLKPGAINEAISKIEEKILDDQGLSDAEKQAKIGRLYEMKDIAKRYHQLASDKVATSKELGNLGGEAFVREQFPDSVPLTPFDGAFDGNNTIDRGDYLFETENGAPTLVVIENKGVGSKLGDAATSTGRAEQCSPEHTVRTLEIDQNLARILNETPEQMRARGLDPASAQGQRLAQAKEEMLKAFHDGRLNVEVYKVHTDINGNVTVTKYSMERDGIPAQIDNIGGVERVRLATRDLVAAREQELARDLAEQRARVLENLDPRQREIAELAVDLVNNRLPNVEATLEYAQAREALDRAWRALEQGAPLSEVSKALALVEDHLAAGQQLEFGSRLAALRDFDLGDSAAAAEHVLEISLHERDNPAIARLQVAERQLIEAATQRALEFRGEHVKERSRFVQHNLNQARELERAIAQGKVPELAEVLRNFDATDRVVQHERQREAQELEKLGLNPEHQRLVSQALEAERARTLGKARDVFREEIVRQATGKVLEAREPEERERAQFLQRIHEQARELEHDIGQGKEPNLEYVRQAYGQLQHAIGHERSLEAQALEPLGLSLEQNRIVTEALEAQRAQAYGKALETFGREAIRLEHNNIVGSAKGLQLTHDQARTLDIDLYQLVRTYDPVDFNRDKGVFLYQAPGKEPIEVPYGSLARRSAEAVKAIERGLEPNDVMNSYLTKLSQGKDPLEAVREPPMEPPHVTRARELLERERSRENTRSSRTIL
ncbi:hypothetical protein CRH09_15525 [Nocardia terpenica]|uniref:Uncharacterized protein n=2 Tax=Nocardia terpenica TaxID=455432 RepID=A0A291RX23_9NOCA|nr:hypothetical protein CRH09_15525 [Nocardia terpenica]